MLKQIAWNTFKTTGNIDTMLELLEVDKTMDNIENYNIKEPKVEQKYELEIEKNKRWDL